MTIVCQPIDVSGGTPTYSAQNSRQAFSGLLFNGTARPLGSQSGATQGSSPALSVSSSTWSVGPGNFVVDAAYTATQAPYLVSSDATVTGSMTAAGSVARTDSLDLRVDDNAVDSSGARQAIFIYNAGNATTGVVQPLAARSVRIATFNVPASGNGSPTVSAYPQYAVAAGGILPVASAAMRNSLITNPSDGMFAYQQDTNVLEVYNGAGWDIFAPSGHASVNSAPAASSSPSPSVSATGGTAGIQALSSYSTLPFASIVQISWGAYVQQGTASDNSEVDLRISGTIVQAGRFSGSSGNPTGHLDILVAANTAAPALQTIISKISGSGTATVSPNGLFTYLNATVIPA